LGEGAWFGDSLRDDLVGPDDEIGEDARIGEGCVLATEVVRADPTG
jgi:hypothetical protein